MQGLNDDDRTFPSSMVSVPFPEGARRILLRSLLLLAWGVLVPAARCIARLKSSTHPQDASSIPAHTLPLCQSQSQGQRPGRNSIMNLRRMPAALFWAAMVAAPIAISFIAIAQFPRTPLSRSIGTCRVRSTTGDRLGGCFLLASSWQAPTSCSPSCTDPAIGSMTTGSFTA